MLATKGPLDIGNSFSSSGRAHRVDCVHEIEQEVKKLVGAFVSKRN